MNPYQKFELVRRLVEAQQALETARNALCAAREVAIIPVREKLDLMVNQLYANRLGYTGSDAKAWDIKAIISSV